MPVVPSLEAEKYLNFKEMTGYLRAVGKAAPHLVRVFSIGKSRGGRPLLVAEVTNRNLKSGREKPGLWIDGGHQGWNLLGSMACLELLRFLVAGHGRDEFLTDLVDHNVFYLAPRLAPDQMELCLSNGAIVPQDATTPEAYTRQFRIESPVGSWKPFKRDARVMVPRNPEDRSGPFYDLYRHLTGPRLKAMNPDDFPTRERMGESLPLRLPSTKAVFDFLRSYKNVFGVISNSGPGDCLKVMTHSRDINVYNTLGQRLGELSGLPFSSAPAGEEELGSFLAWSTQTLGVLSVECQLWSLRKAAGLPDNPDDPLSIEDNEMLQLLRFCEKDFPHGFADWNEAEEPDLGEGEVGGWDWSQTWLNPPAGPYLARELKRFSRLALGLASAGPRLAIAEVQEKVVGWNPDQGENEPLRHLSVRIENRGYLPTRPVGKVSGVGGTVRAQTVKGSGRLLIGDATTAIEDLQGTGFHQVDDGLPQAFRPNVGMQRSVRLDFLFSGAADIEIAVAHPMAGTDKVVSRQSQILQPPGFSQASRATQRLCEEPAEEAFEEVFPSFEEMYEPDEAATITEEPPKAEPPPPPLPMPEAPAASAPQSPSAPKRRPTRPVAPPKMDEEDEFSIPLPPMPGEAASKPRSVEFQSLDEGPPKEKSPGPFPAGGKPVKGRVFGSPPQKPGGGLPISLAGGTPEKTPKPRKPATSEGDGEFSPLPLVGSGESGFEPLVPTKENMTQADDLFDIPAAGDGDSFAPQPPSPRKKKEPSADDRPSAPPARLSRISAPQLLRRQRGSQQPGSGDPFGR